MPLRGAAACTAAGWLPACLARVRAPPRLLPAHLTPTWPPLPALSSPLQLYYDHFAGEWQHILCSPPRGWPRACASPLVWASLRACGVPACRIAWTLPASVAHITSNCHPARAPCCAPPRHGHPARLLRALLGPLPHAALCLRRPACVWPAGLLHGSVALSAAAQQAAWPGWAAPPPQRGGTAPQQLAMHST